MEYENKHYDAMIKEINGIRAVEALVDFRYVGGNYPMRYPYAGMQTVEEYVREAVKEAIDIAKSEGKEVYSLAL